MDQVVMVGFGNIGQAVVPLLRSHYPHRRIVAIDQHADVVRVARAREMDVELLHCRVDAGNYQAVLKPHLYAGAFLLNLAPAVSSTALIKLAQSRGAFYLDTGIEPWAYELEREASEATSNHALREAMLALQHERKGQPTALVAHGANPGFVSLLVKQALLALARVLDHGGLPARTPTSRTREQWAALARDLDVRVIQISECDTQHAEFARDDDEFVNTWSVDGFVTECLQPVELGWGTHERGLPEGGRVSPTALGGQLAAVQLTQRGHEIAVQTWTPLRGAITGCILTHNESLSIADYLTVPANESAGTACWRPTVYYAYRPCEDAIASLALLEHGAPAANWRERVLKDELVAGEDELGVLLMSGRGVAVWMGSALSIARTRTVAPCNNATSLQVVSSLVAGMHWIESHPREGIVESDAIDDEHTWNFARPYWEPIQCVQTAWRPQAHSHTLYFDDFLLPGITLRDPQPA
ncbi:saccharopine dehydrogenase NADP-binding domain-containing protein [Burkholderia sp. Ax-1719]|uniref:saccharopine dehydrogenase NADP-binding domain-containing protein n=1 Tax=Burkholderia sp. Ax-1719 TaxID=2608334 RepID=UPI0014249F81|nr:saccharopine dehydrogenase NADP-binding domain-containing protein [Burkholderia sp. Ax-1719]NIE63327.1 homospermidine synthase [Burkholderia sp. Ax-1719]